MTLRPRPLPRPLPRQAGDARPDEAPVQALFGGLRRAVPSSGLRERCLTAPPVRPAASGGPARLPWLRPAACAASVLLLLGVGAMRGSSGSAGPAPHADEQAPLLVSLKVVDDPSVPLFHGVETFQELARWPTVASMEPPSEGRGPR